LATDTPKLTQIVVSCDSERYEVRSLGYEKTWSLGLDFNGISLISGASYALDQYYYYYYYYIEHE